MKKEHKEKRIKARAEARPKKLMDLIGWEIFVDERNYMICKGNKSYYFSSFENAIIDISKDLEKSLIKENLIETVKSLKQGRKDFLMALSKAVPTI